jgi:hypothetical protein
LSREARTGALLYLTDGDQLLVYSYPAGKRVGILSGFYTVAALCSDASGNVFIPNAFGFSIEEYAHGATQPKAWLWDYGQMPEACSVDPVTGDLAVTNSSTANGGPGSVAFYHNARGWPRYVEGKDDDLYWFCGYDSSGNLFYDYQDQYRKSHLMELARGTRKPKEIKLKVNIAQMGAIQWDGKYITIGDDNAATVYRLSVSGSSGHVVSATKFNKISLGYAQYWIQGNTVVIPFGQFKTKVGFWKYPLGGNPRKVLIHLSGAEAFGVTVSLAK